MSTEATLVQDVRNEPPTEPTAHAPVRDFSQGTDNQVAIEVGLDLLPEWVAMIDGKFDEKEQGQIRAVTSPVLVIECTEKKDAFRDLLDSEKSAFGRDGLWRELLEEFAEAVDAEPSEKRENPLSGDSPSHLHLGGLSRRQYQPLGGLDTDACADQRHTCHFRGFPGFVDRTLCRNQ
jgi:hypothetical protein